MGGKSEPEFLVIDGRRFSSWRGGPAESKEKLGLSWQGLLVGLSLVGVCFAVSIVGLRKMPSDPDGATRFLGWFFGGFLLCFYILAIALVALRRRGTGDLMPETPPRPDGVPPSALFVGVAMRAAAPLGGTPGWLFADRGWLVFRGDGFDFRLRRSDFKKVDKLEQRINRQEPIRLAVPKGLILGIRIRPGTKRGGRLLLWPAGKEPLRRLIEDWLSRPEPTGDSLLPPITHGSKPIPLSRALLCGLQWLPIGVAISTGLALLDVLAPDGLIPHLFTWDKVIVTGLFITFFLPLMVFSTNLERKAYAATIRKRVSKGNGG